MISPERGGCGFPRRPPLAPVPRRREGCGEPDHILPRRGTGSTRDTNADNQTSRVITGKLAKRCAAKVVLICFTMCAAQAEAEEQSPETWLNPGFFSYHFDRDKRLREDNFGIGAEVFLRHEHGLMVGTFINSDYQRTRYTGYEWRPLHWQTEGVQVRAGITVTALDGYPRMRDGGWFLSVLPIVALEGERFGVNFTVVPQINNRLNGAVVMQVRLRVW